MKKLAATRQKEKTKIEHLSQAELVGMVLGLQKIIEELRLFRTYCAKMLVKGS